MRPTRMTRKASVWIGACLLLVTVLGFVVAGFASTRKDKNETSTVSYLRARYALERAIEAELPAIDTAAHRVVTSIDGACPLALAKVGHGSSEDLAKITAGVMVTIWRGMLRSQHAYIVRFAGGVKDLRWSDGQLQRLVRLVAHEERRQTKADLPDVCKDIKAWANSGYRRLPLATMRLAEGGPGLLSVNPGTVRVYDLADPQEAAGAVILRRLRPYEGDAAGRRKATRVAQLEALLARTYGKILADADRELLLGLGVAN